MSRTISKIELTLKNKSMEIEFNNGMAIIYGGNGVGKTTTMNGIYSSLCHPRAASDVTSKALPFNTLGQPSVKIWDMNEDEIFGMPDDMQSLYENEFNNNDNHSFQKSLGDFNANMKQAKAMSNRINYNEINSIENNGVCKIYVDDFISKLDVDIYEQPSIVQPINLFTQSQKLRSIQVRGLVNYLTNAEHSLNNLRSSVFNIVRMNTLAKGKQHKVLYLNTSRNREHEVTSKSIDGWKYLNERGSKILENFKDEISFIRGKVNEMKGNFFQSLFESISNDTFLEEDIDLNLVNDLLEGTVNINANIIHDKINSNSDLAKSLKAAIQKQTNLILEVRGYKNNFKKFGEIVTKLFDQYDVKVDEESMTVTFSGGLYDIKNIDISKMNFSSGEANMIRLLSITYLSKEKYFLLMIDEPELSLSAAWQKELMKIIDSDIFENKMIVTHSPLIMSKNNIDSVQVFKWSESKK